ncbi:MAG: type IV secretory system conjugative DNA transfer family protein [Candidatus Helarchaeales archaeon]
MTREGDLQRTVIVGEPGSGKTVLLKKIVLSFIHRKRRILILDPEEEFTDPIFKNCDVINAASPEDAEYRVSKYYEEYFFRGEKEPLWVVVDEAQIFLPLRKKSNLSDYLLSFIVRGRKRGIRTILTTQRPSRLEITPRTLWTSCFIFSLKGRDLALVKRDFGVSREHLSILPWLPVGTCLCRIGRNEFKLIDIKWFSVEDDEGGRIII